MAKVKIPPSIERIDYLRRLVCHEIEKRGRLLEKREDWHDLFKDEVLHPEEWSWIKENYNFHIVAHSDRKNG